MSRQYFSIKLILVAVLVVGSTSSSLIAAPGLMDYQGYLEGSTGFPITDTLDMTFKIFTAQTGGTQKWGEDISAVEILSGLFNVTLGSDTALADSIFNADSRWLEVTVNGTTMDRARIVTTAYSFRVETIDGATGGQISGVITLTDTLVVSSIGIKFSNGTVQTTAAGASGDTALALSGGTMTGPIDNVGDPSITMGKGNFGRVNSNAGLWAFVSGDSSSASGNYSVAIGKNDSALAQWSAVVGGHDNISSGQYSGVFSGARNQVTDFGAIAIGGHDNTASATNTFATGGFNVASQPYDFVAGLQDTASGGSSTVGGGYGNHASGQKSVVAGGQKNTATGNKSTISGGELNNAESEHSTVSGGINNKVESVDGTGPSTIGGGENNLIDGGITSSSVIGGGKDNHVAHYQGTISGGVGNSIIGSSGGGTIGGGLDNTIDDGFYAVISGGVENKVTGGGTGSVVGGGFQCIAFGKYATICGGGGEYLIAPEDSNVANGAWATIVGGRNQRAIADFAFVGGGRNIKASGIWSTVGGGLNNKASDSGSWVGGGEENSASKAFSSIGGGQYDTASGTWSTIGGGQLNIASGDNTTVSGGHGNEATAIHATIGGGHFNLARGIHGTIPGGRFCRADGDYSFAAGRLSMADHDGSWVWGDHTQDSLKSTVAGQFLARASGGVKFYSNATMTTGVSLPAGGGSWSSISDSTLKRNIRQVNGKDMLRLIEQLPVSRWSYKSQDESIEHIGPMAQDFYRLFGLGDDDRTITTLDLAGIALAAIKQLEVTQSELISKQQELLVNAEEIKNIREELDELRSTVKSMVSSFHSGVKPSAGLTRISEQNADHDSDEKPSNQIKEFGHVQ